MAQQQQPTSEWIVRMGLITTVGRPPTSPTAPPSGTRPGSGELLDDPAFLLVSRLANDHEDVKIAQGCLHDAVRNNDDIRYTCARLFEELKKAGCDQHISKNAVNQEIERARTILSWKASIEAEEGKGQTPGR